MSALNPTENAVRLQGDGFVLRRWRADDLDDLVANANDPAVARATSDRFPHPYTRDDGIAFLEGRVVDFSHPVFAIEIDGAACGGIGARPGALERAQSAEIGYWLAQKHWGRGVMTRAVGLFAPWVMDSLALYRLFATVLETNPASARVLAKCGFDEEGVERCAVVKHGRVLDVRVLAKVRKRLTEL